MNLERCKSVAKRLELLNYAKFIKTLKNAQLVTFQQGFMGSKRRLKRFICDVLTWNHVHGEKSKSKTENKTQRERKRATWRKINSSYSYYMRCTQFICTSTALKPHSSYAKCKITYSHLRKLYVYIKSYAKNFLEAHIIINLQNSVGILNRR